MISVSFFSFLGRALACALLFLGLAAAPLGIAAESRPNVLLIYVDDLGYHDLGCQGATDLDTPNIDGLAASGVRFTSGYVTAPQCGPSRAGLITGMNQARFRYNDNKGNRGLPPASKVPTIAEYMKESGYQTGVIGKWHIGDDEEKGWDWQYLPHCAPWERGFDFISIHSGGMTHGQPYSPAGIEWMERGNRPYWLLERPDASREPQANKTLPASTHLVEYFSTKASAFIHSRAGSPWFLYLNYNQPHTPLTPLPASVKRYAHIEDEMRRKFAATMFELDRGIGEVIKALEESGQRENTLVWFVSDNGGPTTKNGSRNHPYRGVKGDIYEGGIRVPFIASWPGVIEPGQSSDAIVSTLDLLPTSAALAGAELRAAHEGVDLMPWLSGERKDATRPAIYWSWRGNVAAIRVGMLKEIRNGKGVRADPKLPNHLSVDFASNPTEDPQHPLESFGKAQLLSSELDAWLQQLRKDAAEYSEKSH